MNLNWLLLSPDDNPGGVATAEADPSPATDVDPAPDPSPAPPDDKRTLADVVKETAAKSSPAPSPEGDEPKPKVEGKTDPQDPEPAPEEPKEEPVVAEEKDKELPFHKHPRFQEVIKERAKFKEELESVKPLAASQKALIDYCQKNGISNDEFCRAIELAALVRVDPAKALEQLRTFVDGLEVSVGNKLPADLQKEVDEGTLSEARAKELTKARLANQGLEQRGRQTEAQAQQERQQAIAQTVNAWDAQKRTSDPAYDKKYPLVEKAFIALCTTNPPRTPQDAVKLAEQAYAEVNTALGSFTPKPPKKKVLQVNGSVSHGDVALDPKEGLTTALPKIVKQVLAAHR